MGWLEFPELRIPAADARPTNTDVHRSLQHARVVRLRLPAARRHAGNRRRRAVTSPHMESGCMDRPTTGAAREVDFDTHPPGANRGVCADRRTCECRRRILVFQRVVCPPTTIARLVRGVYVAASRAEVLDRDCAEAAKQRALPSSSAERRVFTGPRRIPPRSFPQQIIDSVCDRHCSASSKGSREPRSAELIAHGRNCALKIDRLGENMAGVRDFLVCRAE